MRDNHAGENARVVHGFTRYSRQPSGRQSGIAVEDQNFSRSAMNSESRHSTRSDTPPYMVDEMR